MHGRVQWINRLVNTTVDDDSADVQTIQLYVLLGKRTLPSKRNLLNLMVNYEIQRITHPFVRLHSWSPRASNCVLLV